MNESLANEIKQVIDVISLLQARELRLRKELDFFNSSWNEESDLLKQKTLIFPENFDPIAVRRLYLSKALRRLDHEVMFLCIDVYSFYQGVQKKKSLYAKIIKNYGKAFMKIDESEIISFIDLGVFESGSWRESSDEEKERYLQLLNEEALKARKELKNDFGPKSHNHFEMDQWMGEFSESETVGRLAQYRKKFAHRLDTLDNLKEELMINTPDTIKDMLDDIREFLDRYRSRFHGILGYTTSEDHEGDGTDYISLSQMMKSKGE